MEHFRAHTDALTEAACPYRTNHKFLETDRRIGMRAAVDYVHHRHGKHVSVGSAYVFVKRKVEIVGRSLGHGERHAKDGVRTEIALCRSSVKLKHSLVNGNLVKRAHADKGICDGAVYVGHSLQHTLSHIAFRVAVAQLKSLVHSGRSARRNGGTATCAAFEFHVNFDCRVATGIKHLAANDFCYFHLFYLKWVFTFSNRRLPQRVR